MKDQAPSASMEKSPYCRSCGGGGEGVVGVIDVGAGEGCRRWSEPRRFREGDGGGGAVAASLVPLMVI